jgi:hypothetical protein
VSKRPKNRRPGGPSRGAPGGSAFGIHQGTPRRADSGRGTNAGGTPELHREVERLLRGSAVEFLAYVSTLAAALDPDPLSPGRPAATLSEFIGMLRATGARATDALLLVLKEFAGDDVLAQRIAREVAGRRHPLPEWLTHVDRTRPARAFVLGHVLGDGENLLVELVGSAGPLTLVLYIDHNYGTIVKDGYVIDRPFDQVVDELRRISRDQVGVTETDLSLADAAARISTAVARGRSIYPPSETDTWPASRPLAEWMLRLMPPGGTGYDDSTVEDAHIDALVDRLARDPGYEGFDARSGSDDRDIAAMLMRLTADHLGGDPLRWTPVTVEILLADLFPRKVHADARYLSRVPDVMRHVVVFAHGEHGIPGLLTADTLRAVDEYEQDYREAAGVDAGGIRYDDDYYRSLLLGAVGGEPAMTSLDLEPLPDEPLSLDGIPSDIHEKVAVVAAIAGDAAERLFDRELRLATQRVLSRIAAGDPAIFRRNSKVEMTAAAVLWITATTNEAFRRTGVTTTEMMAELGLKGSPSQRAEPMLRVLGAAVATGWSHNPVLGDPALLTSARRDDLRRHWEWVNGEREYPWDDDED